MKKCAKCTRGLPDYDFYPKKLKDGTIGLRAYCKSCGKKERDEWRQANKVHDDARNNDYNKKNARKIRGYKLTKYWPELTWEKALDRYDDLLKHQNGVCYLCSQLDKRVHPITGTRWKLAIDHDENTGKVRGLLCNAHNRALGLFNHDIELLHKAMLYLQQEPK